MNAIQLPLFEEDRITMLEQQIIHAQKSCDNVRRGLFARHNELQKMILQIQEDVNILKTGSSYFNKAEVFEFFKEI